MKIHELRITLTDADLGSIIAQALSKSALERVRNIHIACLDGSLKIGGEASYPMPIVGPVAIAFELACRLLPSGDGRELEIQIESVSAAKLPASMANQLIPFLLDKLSDRPELRIQGRSIFLSPFAIVAQQGLSIEGTLRSIEIHLGEITIAC